MGELWTAVEYRQQGPIVGNPPAPLGTTSIFFAAYYDRAQGALSCGALVGGIDNSADVAQCRDSSVAGFNQDGISTTCLNATRKRDRLPGRSRNPRLMISTPRWS